MKWLQQSIGLLCLFFSAHALALINIEITQGSEGALPIAVLPLTSNTFEGGTYDEVSEIVRADLSLSGRFAPLASNDLPFDKMGSWVHDLDMTQWRHIGVEYVLLGQMTPNLDGTFNVHVKLLDTYQSRLKSEQLVDGELMTQSQNMADYFLFDKHFDNIKLSQVRDFAHHVSNLIYQSITGIPGHFSTRIAYIQVNHDNPEFPFSLEIADMDGNRPQTVVQSTEPLMSPAWSSDGRHIAYVSFENFRSEIYLLEVATGERQLISHFPRINGAPAFSPDGQKLAIVLSKDGSPKLYLLDIETKETTQLTSGYSIDTEPSWAPDGQSIVFTSNRSGSVQIYRYWLSNGEVERLTFEGQFNARASFAPDGQSLVLIHKASDNSYRVATYHLENQTWHFLSQDTTADESPTLSPNGQVVLYATGYQGKGILAAVSTDGRMQLHLPAREGSVQEPAWSPFLS